MTIKQRLMWLHLWVITILAFPFTLIAFLVSMLALGGLYLAKAVFMPAYFLYRVLGPKPKENKEYKLIKNWLCDLSEFLLDKADWR